MKKIKQKIYYDKKGELLGIEILNASKVLGSKLGFKSSQAPAILYKIH